MNHKSNEITIGFCYRIGKLVKVNGHVCLEPKRPDCEGCTFNRRERRRKKSKNG